MELKSALKMFFPFKIVCNDRGKPCCSDWKSYSFQNKHRRKIQNNKKKILLSFAKGYGEKDKPMIKTQNKVAISPFHP